MAKTKIEWCDFTLNWWIGCQQVSPACDNCYAMVQNSFRHWVKGWGPKGERRATQTWKDAYTWERRARKAGERYRVFSNSLSDFFDNKADPKWRAGAWKIIKETTNLDWLLLTKRPQNIPDMLPADWGPDGYPNVWLGTTVENQEEAERRIPKLLDVPARLHFLSCEPLLGPLDIRSYMHDSDCYSVTSEADCACTCNEPRERHVGWVICGGESGKNRRRMHYQWPDRLRSQCAAAGVPFFMKQIDKVIAIPPELMVREFPVLA